MPQVKASAFPPANEPTAADGLIILQDSELRLVPLLEITGDNTQHVAIDISALAGAGSKPTLGDLTTAPATGVVMIIPKITFDINDKAYLDMDLPHEMDMNQDAALHITWANAAGETAKTVQWEIDYSLVPYTGGDYNAPVAVGNSQSSIDNCSATLDSPEHSTSCVIANADLAIGRTLLIRLGRVSTAANPITDPYITLMHLEFSSDKLGTG